MAIGERIKFFRNLRGMTQKHLGELLGFKGKAADVRVAQYESEVRTPKDKMVEHMAYILDVSPWAIDAPDIDTYYGLMHTLFAIEDKYGLKVEYTDGKICLGVDRNREGYRSTENYFREWGEKIAKLKNGELTKEEYDHWRYNFPKYEAVNFREDNDAWLKEDVAKLQRGESLHH